MKITQRTRGRIVICVLIAFGSFLTGMFYGEKQEKRRITKGFIDVRKQNFGDPASGNSIPSIENAK